MKLLFCTKHEIPYEGECGQCITKHIRSHHYNRKLIDELEKEYDMSIYSILTEVFHLQEIK